MPKIIKDLKPHIKEEAFKLFKEVGYDKVSMRALAKAVGIAVGTLYNYFPNKDAMYTEILLEDWETTHSKLKAVLESYQGQAALKEAIILLMEDVKNRGGLGRILIGLPGQSQPTDHIKEPFLTIFENIIQVFSTIYQDLACPYPERKAVVIFNATITLNNYFDSETDNLDFLMTL